MSLQPTVDSMIEQVRSRLDLAANEGIDDTADILPALNRAKDYAFDILARLHPEPLLKSTTVAIVSGTSTYTIPDDAFEDRLLKVDWQDQAGLYQELDRLSYRETADFESPAVAQVPQYYVLKGRTYTLVPTPSGGTARIWYLSNPEDYVPSLARITAIDLANQTLSLSDTSSLTTATTSLGAYLNIIDGQTGEIKYSVQAKTIDSDNLTLVTKSSASRPTVLGRTIETDLTSLDITEDDHICAINGTCIPFFRRPVSNFCIEYATAEMKDKTQREGTDLAQQILQKFEQQVERSWVRREVVRRIRKNNRQFKDTSTNPFYWRTR